MKQGIWALAIVALAAPAAAQNAEVANKRSARRIALADALTVAVRQNPGLEKARIDTHVADQQFLEAAGIDDWVLTASGQLSFDKRVSSEDNPFRPETSAGGRVGIERSLRTGGTFGVSATAGGATQTVFFQEPVLDDNGDPVLDDNGNAITITATDEVLFYTLGVSVSVTQPLLRGFGSHVARAAERQAKVAKDSAVISGEIVALDIVSQIVTAYWELAYAYEEVEIRKASLALAQEQLRITRAAIEAGAVARTEALAIEQGIAVREEAIVLAEINVAEKSLAVRRLVGMEVGPGEIGLAPADPLAIDERDFDLDQALTKVENNPQLALLRSNGDSAKIQLELTKDGVRPALDLSASGGPTGASSDIGNAFEQIGLFKSWNVQVSLVYRKTLGNRSAEAAVRQAELSQRRILVSYDELKRALSVQLVQSINLVRAHRKRIEVTAKSIELAQQNLKTEQARFEAGDATNFDVLQRQNELEQAQLSKSRATVDFLNAVTAVEALTGDLLGRYGISIDEVRDR